MLVDDGGGDDWRISVDGSDFRGTNALTPVFDSGIVIEPTANTSKMIVAKGFFVLLFGLPTLERFPSVGDCGDETKSPNILI